MFNLITKTLFPLSKSLVNYGFEVRTNFSIVNLSNDGESYKYIVVHKSLPEIAILTIPKSFNYPTLYFENNTYLTGRAFLGNGRTYFNAVYSANKNVNYVTAYLPPFDILPMEIL